MTKREQIRAVRRAIGLAEGLLAIFAAVADGVAPPVLEWKQKFIALVQSG